MLQMALLLICLSQTPQWELQLDPGATSSGAHRANILGATHLFASIPTAPTTTIDSITYSFARGDRICVNDATFVYVYDGTNWRALLSYGGSSTETIVNTVVPYVQSFDGDGGTGNVILDTTGYVTGFKIEQVTNPPISHVNEWTASSHYTQILSASGYVTEISIASGLRWYLHNSFRISYYTVP